ncbi:hypothetical protein Hanom_Chr16g01430181 [Helianthus anomalus]
MSSGVIPPKLTNAIAHLKYLGLFGLSFAKEYQLSFVFLLVSSSPNIKKIKLEMRSYASREVVSQTAKGFFDLLDYSDINLEHLCEIEITNFTWLKPEMDFVKVILAKSPMLANVQIMFDKMIDVQKRCWALEELLKLPRPSSRTKIIRRKIYRRSISQTTMNVIDRQQNLYVTLDHLHEITLTNFTYKKTGMDFVKFVLAKSLMLKKVDIVIDKWVDIKSELKMLKELLQIREHWLERN